MSSLRWLLTAELIYFIVISISLTFLGFYPRSGFDDIFMRKNGLLPFADFRPGYPPLGKLPYYFLSTFFSQTNVYSDSVFLINGLTLLLMGVVLYFCISKLNEKRAPYLVMTVLSMPSVIYLTIVYSRADALVLIFALSALYYMEKPSLCGALCGVGTLVKFYPAFLLLPLLVYYKGIRKRVILLFSFALTVLLISIPFLLSDPLMYFSVVASHNIRGPSESIFSIIDGCYGHTGFVHPTFDATIYTWQFTALYEPSHSDHFRYQWNIPVLPTIATCLQLLSIFAIGWIAKRKESQNKAVMLVSLAMFSYLAFSAFYNPIVHLVQICFLVIATMDWNKYVQMFTLIAFEAVNALHLIVWFSPYFLSMGVQLPLSFVVILRTVLYALVFLNFARRRIRS